jgi:hypothetical protein
MLVCTNGRGINIERAAKLIKRLNKAPAWGPGEPYHSICRQIQQMIKDPEIQGQATGGYLLHRNEDTIEFWIDPDLLKET